jgi:hypothetical protein
MIIEYMVIEYMNIKDTSAKEDLFYLQYKNKIIRGLLSDTMSQKETDIINKEIDYYCLFKKYNPQDIYDLVNNITQVREKYNIPKITNNIDIAKCEPAKCEPAKCEPAKCEPAKCEPAKCEPAKCELCVNKKVHSIQYDKSKASITMRPGLAIDHSSFYVCQHFILEVDKCLVENERFSIVIDLSNYTLRHAFSNMTVAYSLSDVIQKCYNERLDHIYIINSPSYISPMIAMVKKCFHNSIYQKLILQ